MGRNSGHYYLVIIIVNDIHMSRVYVKFLNPFILSEKTETDQSSIKDLLLYYLHIRPVVEYAYDVFHDFLPILEKLQKRVCRMILLDHRYNKALDQFDAVTLAGKRQILT